MRKGGNPPTGPRYNRNTVIWLKYGLRYVRNSLGPRRGTHSTLNSNPNLPPLPPVRNCDLVPRGPKLPSDLHQPSHTTRVTHRCSTSTPYTSSVHVRHSQITFSPVSQPSPLYYEFTLTGRTQGLWTRDVYEGLPTFSDVTPSPEGSPASTLLRWWSFSG